MASVKNTRTETKCLIYAKNLVKYDIEKISDLSL